MDKKMLKDALFILDKVRFHPRYIHLIPEKFQTSDSECVHCIASDFFVHYGRIKEEDKIEHPSFWDEEKTYAKSNIDI